MRHYRYGSGFRRNDQLRCCQRFRGRCSHRHRRLGLYGVGAVLSWRGKRRGRKPFLGCSLLRFRRSLRHGRLHFGVNFVAALGEFNTRRVLRLLRAFQVDRFRTL